MGNTHTNAKVQQRRLGDVTLQANDDGRPSAARLVREQNAVTN